jgi:Mg2+-importing ATPase
LLLTASIMAIGIYIPFSPMAHAIGLRPLPLKYFWWLAGILTGYAVLTQLTKSWFVRRYEYC